MNVPESWLRSFCDPAVSGQELADRLTMAGLEVEAYEPFGAQFSGVSDADLMLELMARGYAVWRPKGEAE